MVINRCDIIDKGVGVLGGIDMDVSPLIDGFVYV